MRLLATFSPHDRHEEYFYSPIRNSHASSESVRMHLAFRLATELVLLAFVFGSPLTLYRVIKAGEQPNVIAAGNVTALGVGESGGTTYKQVEFVTMQSGFPPGPPPLTLPSLPIVTLTRTGTSVVSGFWTMVFLSCSNQRYSSRQTPGCIRASRMQRGSSKTGKRTAHCLMLAGRALNA